MKLKRNDIILIIVVLIIGIAAGLYFFLNKKTSGKAVLKYGNNLSMDIDLSKDREIDLESNGIKIHLNIKDGETTEDGLFTLNYVACLGCCSLAPVMMVQTGDGDETYSELTKAKVVKIIDELRNKAQEVQ